MDAEIAIFFQDSTNSTDEIEIARILKKRTDTVLDGIISGTFRADDPDIENFDRDLLLFFSPKKYTGKDSTEIQYIKSYESLIASVGKWLGYNPDSFTTLRFYQSLAVAKEATRPKKA